MIRAVIFDLYGTLIQLDRVSAPYFRLAQGTNPDDPWEIVRQSLVIETQNLRDFAAQLKLTVKPGLTTRLERELEKDLKSSRVFDDALGTLTTLRESGLKLGLISNAASPYKEPFFRHQLQNSFDASLFSCDFGRTKPDPSIYLRMADQLKVMPREVLMVGDSRTADYNGPKAVGMDAILLSRRGKRPPCESIEGLDVLPGMLRSG